MKTDGVLAAFSAALPGVLGLSFHPLLLQGIIKGCWLQTRASQKSVLLLHQLKLGQTEVTKCPASLTPLNKLSQAPTSARCKASLGALGPHRFWPPLLMVPLPHSQISQ